MSRDCPGRHLFRQSGINRRQFIKTAAVGAAGIAASLSPGFLRKAWADPPEKSLVLKIAGIPDDPYVQGGNCHIGIDTLLKSFSACEKKFYKSPTAVGLLPGPDGIIGADDVIILKVNAQWCFRGGTNTDVLRGLIQRIIEHPDGFTGEIIIMENGQGRGSFNCDQDEGDLGPGVHANALDTSQSFNHLVTLFSPHVQISTYRLDAITNVSIPQDEHLTDGYVTFGFVSYPVFTTSFGTRIDLKNGVWNGSSYEDRLRLFNIPVLKDHSGAQVTAALKHSYGILSMDLAPNGIGPYHYSELGNTTGEMWAAVRRADIHILSAIHSVIAGGPPSLTYSEAKAPRTSTLLASLDPVALDYIGSKYVLYPASLNYLHNPDYTGRFKDSLVQAEATIRSYGHVVNSAEDDILVAKGARGAIEYATRRQRAGEVSARDVRYLLESYHNGALI